jgi:hypothetical protein
MKKKIFFIITSVLYIVLRKHTAQNLNSWCNGYGGYTAVFNEQHRAQFIIKI